MKKCNRCDVEKPLSEFVKLSSAKDGHKGHCKECNRQDYRGYYEKNREKIITKTSQYKKDNPDKAKKHADDWKRKNPERSKARYLNYKWSNIDKCRENDEDYRRRNLHKDAAKTAKRKASKRRRTPPWLTERHFAEINKFYESARDLQQQTGIKHHVDHIVPLNGELVSGLHVPWNLRVIPAKDNLLKSNTWEG